MWSPQNSPQPGGDVWCLFMVGYCAQFAAAVTVAVVAPGSTWGNLVQIGFAYGFAWLCVYAVVGCYAGLVHDSQEPTQDPLLARSEAERGAAEEEKYCGLHSHMLCLSWPCFFCIVCCPVDTKSTDEETSAQCISRSSRVHGRCASPSQPAQVLRRRLYVLFLVLRAFRRVLPDRLAQKGQR